jgi:hypothetical protein
MSPVAALRMPLHDARPAADHEPGPARAPTPSISLH